MGLLCSTLRQCCTSEIPFSCRHKKQKEEDIAICECKFDFSDPDSTCGERCLNVLTSTECTPGYCPCGVYCKNQVKIVSDLPCALRWIGGGGVGCVQGHPHTCFMFIFLSVCI